MSGSANAPSLAAFTEGDIVVSVVGDGNGSGVYGDNQAAPIVLEELNPATGAEIGQETLPQTANGAESAISGEYGSSSEGTLELAGNGQSLVIAGYGVNANTFNTGEQNGENLYGNVALAQSTSLTTQSQYIPVARVVADIGVNGTVDTTTAIYNIFNTNNPRSVATVNGTSFYLSGQGVSGDTTQGVWFAQDGASSATSIDGTSDTRTVEIYNGRLYVSRDSKQAGGGSVSVYGNALPTSATGPATLPGIGSTITLAAAQENTVNPAASGTTVYLSPENFFFANATTLYVADGGDPKEGGIGDGGLQKWTLNTTTNTWVLDYTLSLGLNLVPNSNAAGSDGLIGLTGQDNANGTVTFYTTNETIGDLNQTYVYTITDTLSDTALPTNEAFTVLDTAAADTNVRGIAFAPSTPTSTTISSGQSTSAGFIVTNGSTLTVLSGGIASAVVINSGGAAYISGSDTGSLIEAGGSEVVTGSAAGDAIYGYQVGSNGARVTNETIYDGGGLELDAGGVASNTTIQTSGFLDVQAGAAVNISINGGSVDLASPFAVLNGTLVFSGSGAVVEAVVASSGGYGINTTISNFAVGDVINLPVGGLAGDNLGAAVVGGNTVETIVSGSFRQSLTFAGQYLTNPLELVSNGAGVELTVSATSVASGGSATISSGFSQPDLTISKGAILTVKSGGTLLSGAILSSGSATIAGADIGTTVSAGGTETISGTGSIAAGDQIYGTQTDISGTLLTGASIYNSGTQNLSAGSTAVGETVYAGGTVNLHGGAVLSNTVLEGGTVNLQTGSATVNGGLEFDGSGEVIVTSVGNAGDGLLAVVSGFTAGDIIDAAFVGANAALTQTVNSANSTTSVTLSGSTGSETVVFAGIYGSGLFQVASGTDIGINALPTTTVSSGQSLTGFVVSGGTELNVLAGGSAVSTTVLSGGYASFGGVDSGTAISNGGSALVNGTETHATILAGGNETVLATANGDAIYGTQLVSAATAVVSNETINSGGALDLYLKGAIASGTVISSGGALNISGNASATTTVISSGGLLDLQSPKAILNGGLVFAGPGGTLEVTSLTNTTSNVPYGDQTPISGFGFGDVVNTTVVGGGATLTSAVVSGDTDVTISGSLGSEVYIFAGSYSSGFFQLTSGTEITNTATVPSGQTLNGYIVSSNTALDVLGTVSGTLIQSGGVAVISSGGVDSGTTIQPGGSETVLSAGTVYLTAASNPGLTLDDGAIEAVGSGLTVDNLSVASGVNLAVFGTVDGAIVSGLEVISSGGVDSGTTFQGSGAESVLAGGTVYITTGSAVNVAVGFGAVEIVAGGVTVDGAMAAMGVTLEVLGTISGTADSGFEIISSGGVDNGTTIESGGVETVLAGGTVVITEASTPGLTVDSGATEIVASGGTVTGATVAAGVTLEVLGAVSATNVSGSEVIASGGVDAGSIIAAGGSETVLAGGTVYITTAAIPGLSLNSGAIEFVAAGVTVDDASVAPGVTLNVLGTVLGTVISSGGAAVISSGGVDSGSTLQPGGSEAVLAGGTVYISAATTSGLTVNSGATEAVASGLTVTGVSLTAGLTLDVFGAVSGTVISSGATEIIGSGGIDSGSTILSGGAEIVLGGGKVFITSDTNSGLTLSSGAAAVVGSGVTLTGASVGPAVALDVLGTVSGVSISSGGNLVISSGGVDLGSTVLAGGTETVLSGGKVDITSSLTSGLVLNSGAIAVVASGVTVDGATVANGVVLDVLGTVSGTTDAGLEVISSGGVDLGSTITGSGTERILAGGTVYLSGSLSSGLILHSGATAVVASGVTLNSASIVSGVTVDVQGTVSAATVVSGGAAVIAGGGTASATHVGAGGTFTLGSGGSAAGTNVIRGGLEVVASGGVDSGTKLGQGGVETVEAGGTVYISKGVTAGLTLDSGAIEVVGSGNKASKAIVSGGVTLDVLGSVNKATVDAGGIMNIQAGAFDHGSIIGSGGMAFIYSGATVRADIVDAGGMLTVSSGGTVSGGLTLSGGTALISGSVIAGKNVILAGSGNLLGIADPPSFAALISGFGATDQIDLMSLTFSSGGTHVFTQDHNSGTLTISVGGHTDTLILAGGYTTSNFVLAKDSSGGTLISYTG